jgi:hypothetical protein
MMKFSLVQNQNSYYPSVHLQPLFSTPPRVILDLDLDLFLPSACRLIQQRLSSHHAINPPYAYTVDIGISFSITHRSSSQRYQPGWSIDNTGASG